VSSPYPKRELRAVWIATVDNIDWPSRKGLPTLDQQKEFSKILDSHQQTGLNAVFVQVRDAADAYYAKSMEPWSEWLTGEQGKAPEPFYDPMEFMIEESHKRGLEFHAWLNLNRAVFKTATSVTANHISKTKPEWILTYDGQKLLNFGIPEVRDYITEVVVNIVKNYDVDGIHFDDYFYPYAAEGQVLKDNSAFELYNPQGFKSIDDWRRNNTDLLIKQIADAIKAQKSYVKFGISPFGVWRNKREDKEGSDTFGYNSSYDNLYADTRKWIKEGWIDYIAPQVYFNAEHKLIPYKNLVSWWAKNAYGRHLYIGQGAYRIGSDVKKGGWSDSLEMPNQLTFNRSMGQINGSIFFSSKSITNNPKGVQNTLNKFYRFRALVPTMPWKDNVPPFSPISLEASVSDDNKQVILTWQPPYPSSDGERASYYVVYRFEKGETPSLEAPEHILATTRNTTFVDTTAVPNKKYLYIITSVDRLHNESMASREIKVKTGK
jgi:uncharacterized lipoprotein YddW (UPF0748 family)